MGRAVVLSQALVSIFFPTFGLAEGAGVAGGVGTAGCLAVAATCADWASAGAWACFPGWARVWAWVVGWMPCVVAIDILLGASGAPFLTLCPI